MANRETSDNKIREPALAYDALGAPAGAFVLGGFREWAQTEDFPDAGRLESE